MKKGKLSTFRYKVYHTFGKMARNRRVSNCEYDKKFYVSLAVNGVLLSGVFCLLAFYIVRLDNDYKDDPQACRSSHPPPEDSFYSCSPCEPMVRTDDADTMRLFMKSSSMVCCKRISPVVKIEVSVIDIMI